MERLNKYIEELDKLKEYMFVRIQIIDSSPKIQSLKSSLVHKFHYLPTFDYFKETYDDVRYSLAKGNLREVTKNNNRDGVFIGYYYGVKYIKPKQYCFLDKGDLWEG